MMLLMQLIEICGHLYSQVDHLRGEDFLGVSKAIGVGQSWNTELDPVWVVADK